MVRALERVTEATLVVLGLLVWLDPQEWTYGYDMIRRTGMWSGSLYPILARLEVAGWVEREREPVDPAVVGRSARVMYRLTADGRQRARVALIARRRPVPD